MPRENGVRPPASRDQADAYRFGLRRLEAALVRGDAVPLHEQLRSQRRAGFAGAVLGMLGLCGVAVYAMLVPSPDWRGQAVVVGATSGSMYVVAHGPDRLVPVANLAAGRLVLAALRAGGATDVEPGTAVPVPVPDATLDAAPRTPTAAVGGAIAVRPDAVVAPRWAVCDTVSAAGTVVGTTVVGGTALPPPLPAGDVVLLAGDDGTTWLVAGGHRHRLDTGDGRLLAQLGLTRPVPRPASGELVGALPEGDPLVTPAVPDRGAPAPAGLPGEVGDVLVSRPRGGEPRYLVVLAGGLQQVPPVVGELLALGSSARAPRELDGELLASAAFVEELRVAGWPAGAVRVVEPAAAPVTCWTWAADGPAGGQVWAGPALPGGGAPVVLAQADGPGPRVDAVAVAAGGAVRSIAPGRAPGAGPLWLLSASGVAYGVVDAPTAAALGVTTAEPAPEAALRLLPTGPPLDLAEAGRGVDVLGTG